MSSPKKRVIFDLDGVIIDSDRQWQKTLVLFLKELNRESSDYAFKDALRGRALKEIAPLLKRKFLLPFSEAEIAERQEEIMRNLHALETKLFPGAKKILSALESEGYLTALTTGSPRSLVDYVLARFSLRPYFDFVVAGDEVNKSKPSPEIYLETAARLRANPKDCVVIEDSINGLKAAKIAGMKTIFVEHQVKLGKEEIKKYNPDKVLKQLKYLRLKQLESL